MARSHFTTKRHTRLERQGGGWAGVHSWNLEAEAGRAGITKIARPTKGGSSTMGGVREPNNGARSMVVVISPAGALRMATSTQFAGAKR